MLQRHFDGHNRPSHHDGHTGRSTATHASAAWRNRVLPLVVPRIARVDDRYGSDVLARDPHNSRKPRSAELPIELGMVVEDAQTGYVGAVVRVEYGRMELEDRRRPPQAVPGRPGISRRRQTGDPDRAATSGGQGRHPDGVGLGGGDRSTCPGGPDRADLRGGPPRRRARRAGVGRRSADRGSGGRIPRRRRRSGRRRRAVPPGPAATAGRARRPPGARLEGIAAGRSGTPRPRRRAHPGRRPSVRRHLASRQTGPAGSVASGRSSRAERTGSTGSARRWAGRTPTRPTSPRRGGASAAGSGTGPTSTRR